MTLCTKKIPPSLSSEPGKIKNLQNVSVTERSINLTWSRPSGNVSFYGVKVEGVPNNFLRYDKEAAKIDGLTAGNRYTFRVTAGVGDEPKWGEAETTTVYTSE